MDHKKKKLRAPENFAKSLAKSFKAARTRTPDTNEDDKRRLATLFLLRCWSLIYNPENKRFDPDHSLMAKFYDCTANIAGNFYGMRDLLQGTVDLYRAAQKDKKTNIGALKKNGLLSDVPCEQRGEFLATLINIYEKMPDARNIAIIIKLIEAEINLQDYYISLKDLYGWEYIANLDIDSGLPTALKSKIMNNPDIDFRLGKIPDNPLKLSL